MPMLGPQQAAFRAPAAGVFPARPSVRPMAPPMPMARPMPAMGQLPPMGVPAAVPGAPPPAPPGYGAGPPPNYGGLLDAIRARQSAGAVPTMPGAAGADLTGLGMAQPPAGIGAGIGAGLPTRKPTLAQPPAFGGRLVR